MANAYLVAKWKLWYKSLDVNHDGKISMEDVDKSRNKFADMHHMTSEKAQIMKANFYDWWKKFIFRVNNDDMAEEQFIGALSAEMKTNKPKFDDHMDVCFDAFFDVIDTDTDRYISEAEFLFAFIAYGHENEAWGRTFFEEYKPKLGLVPIQQIVDSWIHFVVSDKRGSGDIIKKAFEAEV